ncbi:hypothetical protein FsymDg_1895 [Candidatus Protofrankia datiscae]|uniref:Ribbon-helix-helix protein CopG domain-containing protein n=1 Tax=Candidatus Protofrankia datiscae TaxID=2716812 RepID=F8AWJ6_9ACTN|nr:hypothetical protein FsymDg_1895 [Candidatus Protofrankia datiscae]
MRYVFWYQPCTSIMAVNLRLRPEVEAEEVEEVEAALCAEADRSGRSQQAILREAVDRHLRTLAAGGPTSPDTREPLLTAGIVLPPRTPYRHVTPTLTLPDGTTSLDLLDRADRL